MTTTTTRTMTRTLHYGKGYAGRWGNRCWVARITGSDQRYGLRRTFIEPAKVERARHNRARTMVAFSYNLEVDGLYELCEGGERWYAACVPAVEGGLTTVEVSDERLQAWVAALDAGKSDREARLESKGL